ncbi:hypothetical protein IQ243_24565 [Nostocales cyanobacterium LEGE 11386]|nr:hypothetical protein [Nostocales cyanobacterium LEGE 11386]
MLVEYACNYGMGEPVRCGGQVSPHQQSGNPDGHSCAAGFTHREVPSVVATGVILHRPQAGNFRHAFSLCF